MALDLIGMENLVKNCIFFEAGLTSSSSHDNNKKIYSCC